MVPPLSGCKMRSGAVFLAQDSLKGTRESEIDISIGTGSQLFLAVPVLSQSIRESKLSDGS